jgi:FeS assembly SUF system regulator
MIKLGKLTDYAIAVMGQLAHEGLESSSSAHHISGKTGIPEPTVAKVLKLLSAGNLVASERGAAGGYKLVKAADQVSIGEIITVMDGPISIVACVDGHKENCGMWGTCPTKGNWDRVNDAIKGALASVTLAEMMPSPKKNGPTPNYLVKDIHVSRT